MERIRPPYRPDDDIPFKSRGCRITALILVCLIGIIAFIGLTLWIKLVLREMDSILLYLIALFFVIVSPLLLALWHFFRRER